jgi:hypothetical protein
MKNKDYSSPKLFSFQQEPASLATSLLQYPPPPQLLAGELSSVSLHVLERLRFD